MSIKKGIAALVTLLAAIVGVGAVGVAPAFAYNQDCTYYQVCLYYNSTSYSPPLGAVYKQNSNIADYAGYYFSVSNNGSNGAGQGVKNNAAALDSWYYSTFELYYNSNYSCAVHCEAFAAYVSFSNFDATMHNNNASGKFF